MSHGRFAFIRRGRGLFFLSSKDYRYRGLGTTRFLFLQFFRETTLGLEATSFGPKEIEADRDEPDMPRFLRVLRKVVLCGEKPLEKVSAERSRRIWMNPIGQDF